MSAENNESGGKTEGDARMGPPPGEPAVSPGNHWLLRLIRRSLKRFWEQAGAVPFEAAFGPGDREQIADRLIRRFARDASILGGFTGVVMSVDEIVTFATGAEGGMGLPVNLAIAVLILTLETFLLVRFQLGLVACLGKLYGVPLDPDDPEDALTIFAYAVGGAAANAAKAAAVKTGGRLAGRIAKTVVQKEALAALTRVAERVGIRILQLAVIKYALPLFSIGIGVVMNYLATRTIGRVAKTHLKERLRELQGAKGAPP